jgi:hypothetical protein
MQPTRENSITAVGYETLQGIVCVTAVVMIGVEYQLLPARLLVAHIGTVCLRLLGHGSAPLQQCDSSYAECGMCGLIL